MARQRVARAMMAALAFGALGAAQTCTGVTVFQSGFDSDAIGAPPPSAQATGTIAVAADPGSVAVVAAPPGQTGNWAQISRATVLNSGVNTMHCNVTSGGAGSYGLLAVLFVPSGNNTTASVSFSASPTVGGFLHVDFLPDGTARVNDSTVFGSFPHDQAFTISVNLTVPASGAATADISLLGGASGSITATSLPGPPPQGFASVDFFMGFPWVGSFDVTDIIVTKTAQM